MNFLFEDNNYSAFEQVSRSTSSSLGPLAIAHTVGNEEMAERVSSHIFEMRKQRIINNPEKAINHPGYMRKSYIINSDCIRFSSGEGKAVYRESVRGHDLTILADVTNHSRSYKVFGHDTPYSPDDHFQDIKRLILASSNHARRINVVMPYLYQGKQDIRAERESLDCACALKELIELGAHSIICFEPHEPRVENAISTVGLDNFPTSYLLIEKLLEDKNGIVFTPDKLSIVSPDEGGMKRAVYYSSVLGLQLSTFYRERDYNRLVDGSHPVNAIRFLGEEVKNKDVLIIDDMISSGQTMLQTAYELKEHQGAKNIYCVCTFPLFTQGIEEFNQAYKAGLIKKVYGTNLIHHPEDLLKSPWYVDADASPLIAKIIDVINHDLSTSGLMDQTARINQLLENRQHEV